MSVHITAKTCQTLPQRSVCEGPIAGARWIRDGLPVAIKYISKGRTPETLKVEGHGRLLLEVALMTLVSSAPACPNVLQLLEWFDHRRRFTMILERPVPCQDLQSFCEENGHLDESLAKKVLLQVISALKHCKSRGVLHRNIKPENLLISTESHDIKLLDFGCGDLLKDSAYKYFAAQWNQCPYWGALDTELHSRVFLGCRNISCAVCRSLSHSTISCPFINPCIPPCPESSQPESTNPMSRALWIPQPLPHFAAAHRPPAARHDDLKEMLDSNKDSLKLEAMKRIVAMIARGKNASDLFPAVVKNVACKNIEVSDTQQGDRKRLRAYRMSAFLAVIKL
ncbi:serine threonine- kinase pim-3-like protein [Labeo rohita]|uniref:non-specific serine/threonine protein kinase n=1 Tax=Labeo rohita TaxID=84645 RepID=A0A498NXH8_LABRO|nr:serine threonine- kinase pim-3-like protein [Labeo rohita]